MTMADSHIQLRPLGVFLLILTTFISHHVGRVRCQMISNEATAVVHDKGPSNAGLPRKDTLEETVFAEMVRVVDQKFDSLSARITVLERSISSLNFYSIRQFRLIKESLEVASELTEGIRNQVTDMDVDDRALKAAVSQVGRDISVIRTEVSIMKSEMVEVKTDVRASRSEIGTLKSESNKMFDDIANSIVYFNQNVENKAEVLTVTMKQTATSLVEKASNDRHKEDTAILLKYLEDLDATRNKNCNVNFRPLEDRIDLRFAEMKRETHSHFVDLINAESDSSEEGYKGSDEEEEEAERENPSDVGHETDREGAEEGFTQQNSATRQGQDGFSSSQARPRTRYPHGSSRSRGGPGEKREGEQVMRLLANMTQNVMEAVSYFRHTGSMMERLLANTETMADQQAQLRYDVLQASGRLLTQEGEEGEAIYPAELLTNDPETVGHRQHHAGSNVPPFNDDDNLVTDSEEQEATNDVEPSEFASNEYSKKVPFPGSSKVKPHMSKFGSTAFHNIPTRGGSPKSPSGLGGGGAGGIGGGGGGSADAMMVVAEKSLQVLSELAKNGTQLLDVLTDLAQLSSTSLTKAVGSLHQEVVRLEDVRARLNEGLLLPAKAASTGQGGAGGGATSVGLASTNVELRSLHNTTKTIFNIVEAIASNTGWIPYIFHNMQHVERLTNRTLELAKRSLLSMHWNRPSGNEIPQSQAQERRQHGGRDTSRSQSAALDVIYNTNVKLSKIMPALTKLLAEPDALVALAEGKNSQEGRVEVFFRGQWGSVCRRSMGHDEASVVCKHLGYSGGIWAPSDRFESNSSSSRRQRLWHLNVTCLASQLCSFVSANTSTDCPQGHFAVICDHMLRMEPLPGVDDFRSGLVILHHQGRWLPVCGSHGWSGYEARVACQQMGFRDGREMDSADVDWRRALGDVKQWVSGVQCSGDETSLDSCKVQDYVAKECPERSRPAAVRCQ